MYSNTTSWQPAKQGLLGSLRHLTSIDIVLCSSGQQQSPETGRRRFSIKYSLPLALTCLILKLSHKGIILVVVPLVFEFAFVGSLLSMLQQTEAQIEKETRTHMVVGHLNKIITLIMASVSGISGYGLGGGRAHMSRYLAIHRQINIEFVTLENLVADNKEQLHEIQEIHVTWAKCLTLFQKIRQLIDEGRSMGAYTELAGMRSLTATMMEGTQDAIKHAERMVQDNPDGEKERRRQLKNYLIGGLFANAVVAVLLAVYFNQGTSKRLSILMDNTKRLADNKPLHPPLKGDDEIAHLDRVFNEMADALKTAAGMKRDFVAMLSHDLRSPLNSIDAFLLMLSSGVYGTLNDKGASKVSSLDGTVKWLVKLIGDLLDMDRIEAGLLDLNLKRTSLLSVADHAAEALRDLAEKRGVRVILGEEDAYVNADADRLLRVATNFLSNAIKFSPENSSVEIRIYKEEKMAVLEVIDQGSGIPSEMQAAVFERFRQVKNPAGKEGAGLGLAVARALIEQHKGEIGVRSEEGNGSTFWFKLPLCDIDTAGATTSSTATGSA